MNLEQIIGSLLKVDKVDVLEDKFGLIVVLSCVVDVNGSAVGLNLSLKTTYADLTKLLARAKKTLESS